MKKPISERMCSDSMFVPHDEPKSDVLSQITPDYGLKPNGLTIDEMRDNIEFYSCHDDLDRPAIASQVSQKLADDVKKVVRAIESTKTDRNKSKTLF